jgi:hypothetical protein
MILGPYRFQAMHQLQEWDMAVRINVVTSCIILCVKGFMCSSRAGGLSTLSEQGPH